jgi:hypothetical protein
MPRQKTKRLAETLTLRVSTEDRQRLETVALSLSDVSSVIRIATHLFLLSLQSFEVHLRDCLAADNRKFTKVRGAADAICTTALACLLPALEFDECVRVKPVDLDGDSYCVWVLQEGGLIRWGVDPWPDCVTEATDRVPENWAVGVLGCDSVELIQLIMFVEAHGLGHLFDMCASSPGQPVLKKAKSSRSKKRAK